MKKIVSIFCLGIIFYALKAREQAYPHPYASTYAKPVQGKKQNNSSDVLQPSEALFKATLDIPKDLDPKSILKIYYKGDQLPLKNGSFMLKDDANANIFNILFTEAAGPEFVESLTQTARISHIKTHEDARSRYFHLSRENLEEPKNDWKIQEVKLTSKSFKIPLDRTIIVLMNISHLGDETVQIFKNASLQNSKTIISLPTIILHHLLDKQEDEQSTICAQLSSIDLNTIHAKKQPDGCHQMGTKIITYNQSCRL